MADRWVLIESMIAELGDVYSLEVEAAAYPELAAEPALMHVHLALLRATEAMSRVAMVRGADGDRLGQAREALDAALEAAANARSVVAQARLQRNRTA